VVMNIINKSQYCNYVTLIYPMACELSQTNLEVPQKVYENYPHHLHKLKYHSATKTFKNVNIPEEILQLK
jgi:hypothetical protein